MTDLVAPIDSGVIKTVETTEDREAAASWLTSPHEFIAVDTETTGLAYDAEVRLVQFGDQKTAWVANEATLNPSNPISSFP